MIDDVQVRLGEEIRLDLGNTIPVPIRDYNMLFNRPFLNGRELVGMFVLKQSDIFNDVGYLSEETDPTVPAWAKQPQKPTYTAEEVGALSASVIVPTMVSQLTNDSHYYVVPAGGIPLKDLAPGIIPDPSLKLDARLKGVPGGVAELDSNGMVPPHQLPSYVDDVKSYTSLSFFPTVGEDDKIYIDKMTNKQYRWSGDPEVGYVPIASSLALGETSHTAYRGDRGKAAYDHALAKGSAFESGLYKFTTNAEGHIVAATLVTKEDIMALGIPGAIPSIPTRVSDLQNDSNFLSEETDPTVPAWAKQPNKPTYTAQEVGAYVKPVGGIPASDLAAGVIPTVPVTDVQINGSSILENGVANVPMAGTGLGVSRIDSNFGIRIITSGDNIGKLSTYAPSDVMIQTGLNSYRPLTPVGQHKAAFFGLAKVAGYDLNGLEVTLGTYPDAALQAIQKLFGLDGILGDFESSAVASKAYAIGETFIYNGKRYRATAAIAISDVIAPGTNCVLDPIDGRYVKKTDYATANTAGLVKPGSGIALEANTGKIYMDNASDAQIKSGAATNIAIPPFRQHTAAFYGLAKAAGADMANSSNAVGTYTQTAKTAIQTMLGIEADIPLVETVTGATASITGMPNVRYICDTAISELTITPPASGSIVVRFTAGSNCIVSLPQTVKLPEWFDISSLEAGTTYEIIITDGVYGGVMSWA